MARQQFTLNSWNRGDAELAINHAPDGWRVEIKGPRRSLPQNRKLWPMLTDIANQLGWYGRRLSRGKWKLLFMDALNEEADLVPSLDGKRSVNLGLSTSDLEKEEFSGLIEIIFAFGAEHGVTWSYGPDNWGMDSDE